MLKLCLIGKNIKNSRSPELYRTFAKRDGVDLSYELRDLDRGDLSAFVDEVKSGKYNGFNVTAPYKNDIIKYLDYISDDAKAVEAVNTVYSKDGVLYGYNTDIYGARESINPILKEGSILILGRGGAGRAVIRAFKDRDLTIYARDFNNDDLLNIKADLKFIDNFQGQDFVNVINATSVGFNEEKTLMEKPFESQKTAIDLIYTPEKTMFLSCMEKSGLEIKNGFEMLKLQAKMSYKIFLGEIS